EHFDIAAASVQANGREATIAASHTQHVTIDAEGDGLTAKVNPVAFPPLRQGIARHHPCKHQRRNQNGAVTRLHYRLPKQDRVRLIHGSAFRRHLGTNMAEARSPAQRHMNAGLVAEKNPWKTEG